jgi:hypothetical protein
VAYTDSVNGTWTFGYDSLNRLVSGTSSQANHPYRYICWSYGSFGDRSGRKSRDRIAVWTATRRGNQLPDHLRYRDAAG